MATTNGVLLPEVGSLLSAERIKEGLTQQAVAERCAPSQSQISLVEKGLGNPTIGTLEAIAAALGKRLRVTLEDAPRVHTVEEVAAAVASVFSQYGVRRAYLFGSFARGEQDEESDVDLRVELDAPLGMQQAGQLLEDLEDACGRSVDVITKSVDALDSWFAREILAEEVLIYER